jgi:tetratricopeptide (TPR) repeat protein
MKRVFSFQTIFVILLLATSAWAKEVWFELKTPNFQIAGNTEEIREIAEKLEQFHENFQKSFSKFQFKTPFPSKVIVFQNNSKYKQSFIAVDDTNYISISPNTDYADIFHGYANFLINNNLGQSKIPAWLNHGLAEYFANRNGTNNLLLSQQNNLSSLQILLETDYFTLQSQNEERKALFNAQSLAFLSLLLKGDFEKVEELIEHFQNGKTNREALILTFQFDYKKGETEFREFLREPKLITKNNLSDFKQNFQISPISEAESLAVLGEFFYYTNRPKEASEWLEKSLKLEPNQSLALSTLALLKAKEFYYDEAEELAEKAIKAEPDNFQNHYRYAAVLSRQGMTEYGFASGYHPILAEKMRQSLKKAIELNPSFTEPYALFAFVNFVRNEQIDESLKLLRKALEIAPNNQRYLLRLAELNLRKENFIEARKNALDVFRSAPNESLKLYAQNTLQRIDSTEFQLNRIRNEKTKYVSDDIVTDKPLSEEEIRKLREKAVAEQIRAVLRRPKSQETRILASLTKIECGKEKVDFIFKTPTGSLRLQSKSFDEVSMISFIEGLSDFRLNCGNVGRENYASIIYGGEVKLDNLVSIEFVPKGFKLVN